MKSKLLNKNNFYKKRFWAALLAVQFFLFWGLSKWAAFIAWWNDVFTFKNKLHQTLFCWIPFSVGDVLYILLGILLGLFIFKLFQTKNRGTRILNALKYINLFMLVYQLSWGLLYAQQPLLDKIATEKPITSKELKQLAQKYLAKTIASRNLVAEDTNGVFKHENSVAIINDLLQQQSKLPDFAFKQSTGIDNVKSSTFAPLMNYTGILGYYNPFTSEAQYNPNLPSSLIPFTVAHEMAHQLGYAREQEANFIGYLCGIHSDDPSLRYSTELFTLRSILSNLYESDPAFVEQLIENYSEGMKRDRAFEQKFREEHKSWWEDFFATTNDWFLKSNQQDGSITYSYFVELMVYYERL